MRGHGGWESLDDERHEGHDGGADQRSDVAAEDGVGDHLTAPRGVEHDEQARERSGRCGVGHDHADGEHQHADPSTPLTDERLGAEQDA